MTAARVVAHGILLPTIAGAACVFGFAPFYAWPVPIVALAALFWVWTKSGSPLQATLSGFVFGIGYFVAGVSWVFVSLHTFGGMPLVLAALATFLFCAYLALFPALAGWIVARFAREPATARLVLAPAAFTGAEYLRGWLFTGFPWIDLGTSQVPSSPLAGFAPVFGAYGVSLAACATAAIVCAVISSYAWSRARYALVAAAILLFGVGGLLRTIEWTEPAGAAVRVALLQGNVPQQLKWLEEVRTRTLLDYRRMIFEANAKVVVLPETSLPAFLDQLPADYVESIRAHNEATGKIVLMGTVEREKNDVYYNSLVRFASGPFATYRKRHLVPFGEFIPPGFKWVLAVLHIPMSDFDKGAKVQAPLEAGGLVFGVAICYEDVFGSEVIDALPAANALVNVSNDAWFGESFAADQHLQASQTRALESGRWMVRATNTGASAAIDEKGRIVARLAPFVHGTLIAEVTPRTGMTPYARWGDIAALVLVAVVALTGVRRGRKRR